MPPPDPTKPDVVQRPAAWPQHDPQDGISAVIRAVDMIAQEASAQLHAAVAIHEVLNALSPARAYAQLAVADQANPNVMTASAQATLAAISRCEAILDSLLGRRDGPDGETCDVFHVVKQACAEHNAPLIAKPNLFSGHAAVSSTRLRQALVNLVLNARRAAPGGSVRVEAMQQGGTIEVHVIDEGRVGTDLFSQTPDHATAGPPPARRGAGVGLWATYQIIRAAGGDLLARTESPRGTRVIVRLPLVNAAGKVPHAA